MVWGARRSTAFRAVAAAALLAVCEHAFAGNILRPAPDGAAPPPPPAQPARPGEAAADRRERSPLARALEAARTFAARQAAARAAALAAPSDVPDGLGEGALDRLVGGTWVGAGEPETASAGGRTRVTIEQSSERALLTWKTFNVGRGTDLVFDQKAGGADAAGWVALNRVEDPSAAPSRILGSVKAQGQIYVLNQNGILFGGSSQVNVGTLVASGLEIAAADRAAAEGRFLKDDLAGLSFGGMAWAPGGGELARRIEVEAGAVVNAGNRGRVELLGERVRNAGALSADDGQVFLAAGAEVTPTVDLSRARGLAPPLRPGFLNPGSSPVNDPSGEVVNAGTITARRGDVTLVGGRTRQDGLVEVTNGAQAAGSIHLGTSGLASNARLDRDVEFTTTLGPGSVTQILPDTVDRKVLGSGATYRAPIVEVNGTRIDVLGDATLYAPSGEVSLAAYMTSRRPDGTDDPTRLDASRIHVAPGARIDVSGLRDVEVAATRNAIRAELRANELRDNPLLREGPLRSRTVYFDPRRSGRLADGSGVANLGGYLDLVERDVSELMTAGGSLRLAANQIVLREGSIVDVSGGSVRYLPGQVQRTVLVDGQGGRVALEDAQLGVRYVGLAGDFVVGHDRWGVRDTYVSGLTRARPVAEAGYLQGAAAGSLTLASERPAWSQLEWEAVVVGPPPQPDVPAPAHPSATGAIRIFDGEVRAGRVTGTYQRELPGSQPASLAWRAQPAGARLVLENSGDVTFADGKLLPSSFDPAAGVDPALRYQHRLPASWFDGRGFSSLSIASGFDSNENAEVAGTTNRAPGGRLTVGAGTVVDLGTGGAFSFSGKSARIDGTLRAPGGQIAISTLQAGVPGASRLELGATGRLDAAGRWQNDALDGAGPVLALGGGAVSLSASALVLAEGSRVDVSGGGRVDAAGSRLTSGNGGSIALSVLEPRPTGRRPGEPASAPFVGELVLGGALDGRALGRGGSLSLRTGRAVVIGAGDDPGAGRLTPAFFTRGGFASYAIAAEGGLTVSADLAPSVESFAAPDRAGALPTGSLLAEVAGTRTVQDLSGWALPMSLELSNGPGGYTGGPAELTVEAGRSIRMAPGSTVSLASPGRISVGGRIEARGGSIALFSTSVRLSGEAALDVSGWLRTTLSGLDTVRSVERAGSVRLGARGVEPATVELASGTLIDASGVSGVADLPLVAGGGARLAPVAVSGDAGSVSLSASEGTLQGVLRLAPGAAPAGDARSRGAGGSLRITSSGSQVLFTQSAPSTRPGLRIVADTLDASRADDVSVERFELAGGGFLSGLPILFEGDVSFGARRSLTLVSAVLGSVGAPGAVRLRSGYVALVGGAASAAPVAADAPSDSTLAVEGDVVDVAKAVVLGCVFTGGGCAWGGFSTARLSARGDLRLVDHDPAGRDQAGGAGKEGEFPGLYTRGALELEAAQVYVASRGNEDQKPNLERAETHPGFLVSSSARISVAPAVAGAPPPGLPFSFGERLTLRAPVVEQGGVLRAPAGQLRLEGREGAAATGTVELLPGSVTSVALTGEAGEPALAPYGAVRADGSFFGYALSRASDPRAAGRAPTMAVQLSGASVAVRSGAVLDVQGGGDLLGWAFVPGNGGSRDLLEYAPTTPPNPIAGGRAVQSPFAIVPGLGAVANPIGPTSSLRDPRLSVGDEVWLAGVPGLPDGAYTLLPAHYALLPGGLLVQPLGGALADAPAAYPRPDGGWVAGGYRRSAGGRADAAWSQWAVLPPGAFGAYGQLDLYSFNAFAERAAAQAGVSVRTPNDGGSVSLSAGSLVLEGTGRFGAGQGGDPGRLDLAATKVAIVSADRAAGYDGWVRLDPLALGRFGAGSLLVGGTRAASTSSATPGTVVTGVATEVVIDTNGAELAGPEILVTATERVRVIDGSVARASGTSSSDTDPLRLNGDGALLRLSAGGRVDVLRRGGAAGELAIGDATLSASGSLGLDARGAVTLGAGADLASPQLDLSSGEVHLGDAGRPLPGTVLSRALAERLASGADLLLRASSGIFTHGDLDLGTAGGSRSLTLDAPVLAAADPGTVRLVAGTLALRNSGAAASSSPAAGPGGLRLDVGSLRLGPGDVRLGYEAVGGRAGTLAATGAGRLQLAGALGGAAAPFLAGRLLADAGASYAIEAAGEAFLARDPGPVPPAPSGPGGLGARLRLQAATLSLDTEVALPSGAFEAVATAGGLTLGASARVDVSGRSLDFVDLVRAAPAGSIRLRAGGDVTVAAGAALDLAGPDRGGDAGRLEILAPSGKVALRGTLRGARGPGGRGGAFVVDAGRVEGFAALNAALEAAGFTEARELRVRGEGEDLVLAAGERISAHDVTLRADAGRVTVAGAIGLEGGPGHAAGGRVTLSGARGLVLEGTAEIVARAGGSGPDGFAPASGRVVLEAGAAGRVAARGARIDVSGGRDGGAVTVRAARDGDGVAVDVLDLTLTGAAERTVQGVSTWDVAAVDAAWLAANPVVDDAAAWLAAATARRPDGLSGFALAPGILLRSAGSLAISADLSLARAATPGGEVAAGGPGWLGLVAAGDLSVSAGVSDGFASAARGAELLAGRSSSIELEAGGNVLVDQNGMVRTGTGDLSVRAGGNLTFQDQTSVVYTAGARAPLAPGFQNAGAQAGSTLGQFPLDGGSIDLRAGGNVVAPLARQTTSAWLFRGGGTTWIRDVPSSAVAAQTSWSVVPANFRQAVGALGGGDVRVRAGGDVSQLQVSIATTGQVVTPVGGTPAAGDLVVRGGGDLELFAGGDLVGGLFVLGRGRADLRAMGSVRFGPNASLRTSFTGPGLAQRPVGTLLGLADATARVVAGGDLVLHGVFDPMRQGQIAGNLAGGRTGAAFTGYSERTAVEARSVAGTVRYLSNPWVSVDLAASTATPAAFRVQQGGSSGLNAAFAAGPPTLELASLLSSVSVEDGFAGSTTLVLASASRAGLSLLAGTDVRFATGIQQEELGLDYLRDWRAAYATTLGAGGVIGTDTPALDPLATNSGRGFVPVHAGDPEPVRIYALRGSVCTQRGGSCAPQPADLTVLANVPTVTLAKPLRLSAGLDLVGGRWQVRGNGPVEATTISAGRDLYQPIVEAFGTGNLLLAAGRDVVFGEPNVASGPQPPPLEGGAILVLGDRDLAGQSVNAALPRDRGMDVQVLAGALPGRVDERAFAAAYLDPANADQRAVRDYFPDLKKFLAARDPAAATLDDAGLAVAFGALPLAERRTFLSVLLFNELRDTGADYNDAKSPRYRSYDRGYRAISAFFPLDPDGLDAAARGNVLLHGKRVETRASGSISILAPYGRVEVGTDALQAAVDPAGGGVVTRRGGDIRIMADRNVDLFTSRVFTLQGGDITMWTSNGSITAGSGAKTSVFQVPLRYLVTRNALLQVDAFGLATGAGIGVLDALEGAGDRPPSRLDLIAPRGEVNAGDAGIRVVGNLNIAAAVVVGIENIQASGASQGVPRVEAPNIGALTTASAVAQAAAKEGAVPQEGTRSTIAELPSIITVEVVGYEQPADGERERDAKGKKKK